MTISPPTQPLELTVTPDRERAIVAPHGELDIATAPAVEQEVVALCERGFAEVCLDLRGVTFFDSSGLRLLMRLDDRLKSDDCRFSVDPGDGAAARVLRLTRLDGRFAAPSRR
ncbi:STAS domain-containing protein [Conexibacter sp. JD483]|uniref:STAS domain-containing protein n=1 Tax=unclassified Conexibacter TaxID=2627773 RepID=UPI0027289550|nr:MULTISPECIES: STAS domain-containing protein [unclassified Conexibacter]MDO8184899.1 STAS domain-containing protein [Conexibacter sp. CPCC 205706]MDO8198043.1 STAS domain-containing protein [Conexibacter sp. CPCC 205762]MDR9372030.1 STAS domain-containing protein [Conexibacter sp. JD483]